MRKSGHIAGRAGETKPEGREVSSLKLRAKAEKEVPRSSGKNSPFKKQDPDRSVHDLQVYRVELETQNEQLRRTEAALKSREHEYRLIADYSLKLKDVSILLNEASDLKGLLNSVAESFRLFTNSIAATFTVFNKENQTLQVVSLSADQATRPKIEAIFGTELFSMQMPISQDIREELLYQKIRKMKDLHELSVGVISQDNSDLFMQSVGCKQIVACSISDGTDIAGVCTAYLPASPPMVPDYILKPYLYMVRLAIKRMQTEEALRGSEEKYRCLVETAGAGIATIDMKGNLTFVNDRICQLTGYSRQDIVGGPFADFLHKDDLPHLMEAFLKAISGTRISEMLEFRLICKGGYCIWVHSNPEPVVIDGQITGFSAILYDISDRKRLEEALMKSEERYRTILDQMQDSYYEVDTVGNFTFMSESAGHRLGYSCEEMLGQNYRFTVPEEDIEPIFVAYDEVYRTGKPNKGFPHRIRHKDGSITFSEVSIDLNRDNAGEIIGFKCVIRDITGRKKAEAALLEREEQYRLLANNMTDSVWLMDMNLKVTYISPSTEKLRGFSAQELMEMPPEKQVTPESLKLALEAFSRELPGIEADPGYSPKITLELEYCNKDGTTLWMESNFSIVRDQSGKAISILGEARDITDRRLAEEKLVKSYESVKKTLDDAINTMVKIVELRDPYTAGHQQKVADLATAIASEMKFDDTRIELLRTAAIIHDIGKMYVPSDILSKPGKLSDIELGLIKTHSQSGYDIVKSMDFPCSVANTVLQHHERLDGSGYPNGLKGKDTLLEAKILIVADVVEAMASHRPYRPAMGIDKALQELSNGRGKLYDPDVVDTCLELFKSGKFAFKPV